MKNLIIGIVIGMLVGSSVTLAALPNDIWARMFNSYVETDSGNVAVRAYFEI